jgi:hypothetical protein
MIESARTEIPRSLHQPADFLQRALPERIINRLYSYLSAFGGGFLSGKYMRELPKGGGGDRKPDSALAPVL